MIFKKFVENYSNNRKIRQDPIGFLMKMAQEKGDFAHFRIRFKDFFLLNHPDYIRDVLVTHPHRFFKGFLAQQLKFLLGEGLATSEGEHHHRQRRLIQPAFHPKILSKFATIITDYSANLGQNLKDGEIRDMDEVMRQLTLSIAGKSFFSADCDQEYREFAQGLTESMQIANRVFLPLTGQLIKFPLFELIRFLKLRKKLSLFIDRIIQSRRQSGEIAEDLLSMLLAAKDLEGEEKGMTNVQLRDACMTLLTGGHETTALALTWTWYLLSLHPDVEKKFHDEIDRVLGGKLPTYELLQKLRYTDMIFSESLRLYPPFWLLTRRVTEPYSIGNHILPRGSIVLISQFVTHHDTRFFPDPFVFNPERWTKEAQTKHLPFTFIPFGAGPRSCIAEAFARMEALLILSTLGQKWKMKIHGDRAVELLPLFSLRPRRGIPMQVVQRSSP